MEPPSTIELSGGRTLAFDDVGDPAGRPVVYLHGTPDCRLARHPDDRVAARLGVRLVAVDRPGFGRSSPHPAGDLSALGDDLAALADRLGLDRVALLGWSAGGLAALAAAARLGDRVEAIALVGTVPPVEAYADAGVVAALGAGRRTFAELATELPAHELAAEVAPYLVPDPLDTSIALEHVRETAGDAGQRELASVPGSAERLAAALVEAVTLSRDGLTSDVARQLERGLDLGGIEATVQSWHGEHDAMSPPSVGRWLDRRLEEATVEVVPGAGHHLLFTRWEELLVSLGENSPG